MGEKTEALTPREQEIMDMLLAGVSAKEIGINLKLSPKTVEFHKNNLYRKLEIQSIQELFTKYLAKGQNGTKAFASFSGCLPISDDRSTIDGRITHCVTISGTLAEHANHYSGIWLSPDVSTLQAMKTMKSFSFSALGDGKDYYVMLPTEDTLPEDHWFHIFPTLKDEIITITVNVPKDLIRMGFTGKHIEFIQNNVVAISFQIVNPGPFKLKVWDITIYE